MLTQNTDNKLQMLHFGAFSLNLRHSFNLLRIAPKLLAEHPGLIRNEIAS